jgi:hypothetical protein
MTEQHQALIDDLGRKKRGHILHIVRWTDRVHVDRYDIETGKAAQKLDALARRQPPRLGVATPGAHDGSKTSISKHR